MGNRTTRLLLPLTRLLPAKPSILLNALSCTFTLLNVLRLIFFLCPEWDIVLTPELFRDVLFVKVNDLVVVAGIWILLPILCTRCIYFELKERPKHADLFTLIYESVFGDQSRILQSYVPIPTLLVTPISLVYVLRVVYDIYYQWTVEFALIIQILQIYPAFCLFLQTFVQGYFLFSTFTLQPDTSKDWPTFRRHCREIQLINLVLVIHCLCLVVITNDKILYYLAFWELVFCLLVIFSLFSISGPERPNEHAAAVRPHLVGGSREAEVEVNGHQLEEDVDKVKDERVSVGNTSTEEGTTATNSVGVQTEGDGEDPVELPTQNNNNIMAVRREQATATTTEKKKSVGVQTESGVAVQEERETTFQSELVCTSPKFFRPSPPPPPQVYMCQLFPVPLAEMKEDNSSPLTPFSVPQQCRNEQNLNSIPPARQICF